MGAVGNGLIERNVGIGELVVTSSAQTILATHGLGSCVGVLLYDPVAACGGLAHVQLPDSTSVVKLDQDRLYAYADRAVPRLVAKLEGLGAKRARLTAVLAGGADVERNITGKAWQVGEVNQKACIDHLAALGVGVHARRLGGKIWRTVRLYVATGQVTVRTGDREVEVINGPWDTTGRGAPTTGPLVVRNAADVKRLLAHMTDIVLPARQKESSVRDLEDLKKVIAHLTAEIERPRPEKPVTTVTNTAANKRPVPKTQVASIDDVVAVTARVIDAGKAPAATPDRPRTPRPQSAGEVASLLSHITGNSSSKQNK